MRYRVQLAVERFIARHLDRSCRRCSCHVRKEWRHSSEWLYARWCARCLYGP